MKKIIILISLFLLIPLTAFADNYQFTADSANLSSAHVEVYSSGNKVFEGMTDKHGRISINLNNGNYDCKVHYNKKELSGKIAIDGKKEIKVVDVK